MVGVPYKYILFLFLTHFFFLNFPRSQNVKSESKSQSVLHVFLKRLSSKLMSSSSYSSSNVSPLRSLRTTTTTTTTTKKTILGKKRLRQETESESEPASNNIPPAKKCLRIEVMNSENVKNQSEVIKNHNISVTHSKKKACNAVK